MAHSCLMSCLTLLFRLDALLKVIWTDASSEVRVMVVCTLSVSNFLYQRIERLEARCLLNIVTCLESSNLFSIHPLRMMPLYYTCLDWNGFLSPVQHPLTASKQIKSYKYSWFITHIGFTMETVYYFLFEVIEKLSLSAETKPLMENSDSLLNSDVWFFWRIYIILKEYRQFPES